MYRGTPARSESRDYTSGSGDAARDGYSVIASAEPGDLIGGSKTPKERDDGYGPYPMPRGHRSVRRASEGLWDDQD